MSKSKVPQIRFNGFDGEWANFQVADFVVERNIQTPKSEKYPLMAFVANKGVSSKGDRYNREFLVTDEENKKYKQTELGDFIYSSNNLETGSIGLNKYGNATISPVYSIFQPLEIADYEFLGKALIRKDFINKMIRWRQGVIYGQWRIHESDFINIEVIAPSKHEQTKIGKLLKEVDSFIAQSQEKYDKIVKIKSAMLSKMFPKNDAKIPEIRFNGFSEDWGNDTLNNVADIYDGTHQTPCYTDKGIMFLSVENIKTLTSIKFISEEDFLKEFKIFPQRGDVLMTRIGDIGTANVVESGLHMAYYVSLALLKPKKLNPYFLKECIHSNCVRRELWHRTLHIAFPKKINKNEIEKVNIYFPIDSTEQAKIGTFFKKLDSYINLQKDKITKLKNIKSALLEKMFV